MEQEVQDLAQQDEPVGSLELALPAEWDWRGTVEPCWRDALIVSAGLYAKGRQLSLPVAFVVFIGPTMDSHLVAQSASAVLGRAS